MQNKIKTMIILTIRIAFIGGGIAGLYGYLYLKDGCPLIFWRRKLI